MNKEELNALINKENSETMTLGEKSPIPFSVAKLIGAFANTDGGTIIIGVNSQGKVVGTNVETFQNCFKEIRESLKPAINMDYDVSKIDNKNIITIDVGKSTQPITVNGCYFIRENNSIRPYHSAEITDTLVGIGHDKALAQLADSISDQTQSITRLSSQLEKLTVDFERVNSPKRKLMIGGVGAIFGVVLRILFGFIIK